MIKQKEYLVKVTVAPIKLFFAGADAEMGTLSQLNAKGKKLISIFETKDDVQEITRKIAIFEWEE